MGDLKTRFTKTYLAIIAVFLAVVLVITAVLILIYAVNSPSDSFVLHNAIYHYWETEKKELVSYALAWVICVLLAVTVTCVILIMRLYRKVAKPIGELKAATDHICGGDLNTEILGSEDREINDLCRSLDTMRQRLKANQVAEETSKRDRSLLIANISHDMRTPITTIKGYLQAIRDGVADTPDQVEKCYRHIYAKTEFLEGLAADMTEFSQQESGRLCYCFETVEIKAFLKDMAAEYRQETEDKGLAFSLNLPEETVLIRADRHRLQRVVQNLLSNAMKYNKPGGSIHVSLETAAPYAYIRVADSGIGIGGDSLKKIFDTFYREDSSRGNVSGHGLGLAIAKQIIENHRGKIWVQSREGQGTEVFLCLPLSQ
jgi:signal transduction histidine kinase